MGDLDLALGDGAVDYSGFGMSGKFLGHGRMNPDSSSTLVAAKQP